MAHYAFINQHKKVVHVIVGKDEGEKDWEKIYSEQMGLDCKRTSYNTIGGVHTLGGTPLRKNYAGIGYTYDAQRDAFIPPKPFASWVLNEDTCLWDPPVVYPDDGKLYTWNEETGSWDPVETGE